MKISTVSVKHLVSLTPTETCHFYYCAHGYGENYKHLPETNSHFPIKLIY